MGLLEQFLRKEKLKWQVLKKQMEISYMKKQK